MDFTNKAQFVCLSTDTKPTALPGYTDDLKYSLLLELDTLDIYYFNGEDWVKCGESGGGTYYLLNGVELSGSYYSALSGYGFDPTSETDADALSALNTAISGGTYPTLTITCPEFDIDGAVLEWDAQEGNWSGAPGVVVATGIEGIIIVAQNQGETATATITLSFEA